MRAPVFVDRIARGCWRHASIFQHRISRRIRS